MSVSFFKSVLFSILMLAIFVSALVAQSAPLPRADRFGIYNWGADDSAFPATASDRLNWAADKVAELGSQTIRVALPGEIYQVSAPATANLAQIAALPAYTKLFNDPRFKTYLLTTYSPNDLRDTWTDGFTAAEYQAVREEFAQLGEHLLQNSNYNGRTFIILNWEGDNAIAPFADKQSIWDSYVRWIQARADGINIARQRYPQSAVKLFSGLEFNLVRTPDGVPCGSPVSDRVAGNPLKNRCVIDYVAPRVEVDYYSYSAWQTIGEAAIQQRSLKSALRQDLNFALQCARTGNLTIKEKNFIIGEYGFPRTFWGENAAANLVNEMFEAVEAPDAFQVSYAIFWQIIDNAPSYVTSVDSFGLYRSRHREFKLSRSGEIFRQYMQGQTIVPFEKNLKIRLPIGEINSILLTTSPSANFFPQINFSSKNIISNHPQAELVGSDQLMIEPESPDSRFSVQENAIRLEQGLRHLTLPRDFSVGFSESPSLITTSLPGNIRPGQALVYVSDSENTESNTQLIRFVCAECPKISHVEDTFFNIGELYPGSTMTVFGSNFSPVGISIIVEQQDANRQLKRFLLSPESSSINSIKVTLPVTMETQKQAAVTITNANGNSSNEYIVWISKKCDNCAPTFRIKAAILNSISNNEYFHPLAEVNIRGDRFSAQGNRLIIEQGQEKFEALIKMESPNLIRAQLSSALRRGPAFAYVVNAQGQESRAQSLTIIRQPIDRVVRSR